MKIAFLEMNYLTSTEQISVLAEHQPGSYQRRAEYG